MVKKLCCDKIQGENKYFSSIIDLIRCKEDAVCNIDKRIGGDWRSHCVCCSFQHPAFMSYNDLQHAGTLQPLVLFTEVYEVALEYDGGPDPNVPPAGSEEPVSPSAAVCSLQLASGICNGGSVIT